MLLFATGFRAFFLLAAVHAAVWIPLWAALLHGKLFWQTTLPPTAWHAHEMVFGFATVVIAGFLLTAVPKWTGRPTASGPLLACLAATWLAGRVVLLLPMPAWCVVAVDLAFIPFLSWIVGRPIIAARSRRNYGLLALLVALVVCNTLMHLSYLGMLGLSVEIGRAATFAAFDGVLVVLGIVGGRIIPLFTRNALAESHKAKVRQRSWIDNIALAALVLLLAAELICAEMPTVTAVVALAAGAVQLVRMFGWGGMLTLSKPILWILHISHLWLGVGLVLRGLSIVWPILASVGLHMLAIGAIGGLILGMMSRVALGHTGRPLKVSAITVAAYLALQAALVLRIVPLLFGAELLWAVQWSSVCWAGSFALYLVAYLPILTRPRADGKPG